MRRFETECRVAHSADNMLRLVADVERYPEFVPLCTGLQIRDRRMRDEAEILTCAMSVGYKSIAESFTCEVSVLEAERQIDVRYLSGPFKRLDNRWRFEPLGASACEIHFFIAYEFRSMAFQLLAGAVFDKAFSRFVDAFRARADEVYGTDGNHFA